MFQEISRYDEPESVAYHAALEVFWSDQALGRSILGPAKIIRAILHETIIACMAANYRAPPMVLLVSGNIDEAAILAEAEGQFGVVTASSDLFIEQTRWGGGERRIMRGTEQVHFMMGFEGVSTHGDACHSHGVLTQILDYRCVIPVAETMVKIDAVATDIVMATAERIFRSRPAVAAVGRLESLKPTPPWRPISPSDRQ